MHRHLKIRKKFVIIIALVLSVLAILICGFLTGFKGEQKDNEVVYGANVSRIQAEEYGLDWGQFFPAVLDELGVKNIRLPSYWSDIGATQGEYHWGDLDWDLEQASERGVKVILVVGMRQPRWPECHIPDWAEELTTEQRQEEILKYVQATVERYRYHDAIKIWQVENEPLLNSFGKCPDSADLYFLQKEVELVRSLDPSRPILITESGELSTWQRTTKYSDILGISIYRLVWNKQLGFVHWPITPGYYARKFDLVSWKVDDLIVTELQTEPWAPDGILNLTIEDQLKQVDINELEERAEYARLTGAKEVYFWGLEWWYWLKLQGYYDFWDKVVDFF